MEKYTLTFFSYKITMISGHLFDAHIITHRSFLRRSILGGVFFVKCNFTRRLLLCFRVLAIYILSYQYISAFTSPESHVLYIEYEIAQGNSPHK